MSIFQPPQVPISIGLAPTQAMGARMVGPVTLTFQALTTQQGLTSVVADDLIIEGEDGTISNIQSLYFDTSNCPLSVQFTISDTQQALVLPPKSQGYIPILATNSMRYSAVAYGGVGAGANYSIELSFLNVPTPLAIWPTAGIASSLVASGVNAGAATLAVGTNNNGVPLLPQNTVGRDIYIHGFDITGGGATAEAVITATMTNIAGSAFAAVSETLSFLFDVPAIGGSVNFARRFDPPLRGTRTAAGAPNSVILSVPSFGVGNLGMGANLYYTVE